MNIALCYASVLPARGGCETYLVDLSRRLVADGHEVHLYACLWEASALPSAVQYHPLPAERGPRFLRPWCFGAACERALGGSQHQVSIGFDKTRGQDILYPQGGLHAASAAHNLQKYGNPILRGLARAGKWLDLAHWSFSALEPRQHLVPHRRRVVDTGEMVRPHFYPFDAVGPCGLGVVGG